MISNPYKVFNQRSIISIRDFSKEDLVSFLCFAEDQKHAKDEISLKGKVLASCFFEPSTRTRLSFESAMMRLGGNAIGFADGATTSQSKKETLFDSIKVISEYADLIVIRHPLAGSARLATLATKKPVINAGDGSNQHPTQTLIDLFTIKECQNRLENIHIAFTGDLKNSRTIHSLLQAASYFNMRMYFVSPVGFELPKQLSDELKNRSILFSFHPHLHEIMPKLDIIYLSRMQRERLPEDYIFEDTQSYTLSPSILERAKPTLRILHALPRVNEIDPAIDSLPFAYYFEQAKNGLFIRQALLRLILEENGV